MNNNILDNNQHLTSAYQIPEIHMSEKMLELRRRHLPSRTKNTKRKYSDKLLLRILREHGVDLTQLEYVVRRWSGCQSKYTRMVPSKSHPGFEPKTFYRNCKLPFCQRCNSWMKVKQADLMKERFLKLVDGEPLDITQFSMITINGPVLPLGSDFKPSKNSMVNQLRYRMKKLNGAVMQGEFEIAKYRKSNADPYDGKLHLHGILYHPNHTRAEVSSEFKKAFPENRAVHVTSSHTERIDSFKNLADFQDSFENDLKKYASYTCDVDISVEDDQEKTGKVLYDHLISICSIWSGGKRGLCFQPGLLAAYRKKGIKLPNMKRKSRRADCKNNYHDHENNEIYHLSDVFKEELVKQTAVTEKMSGGD